MNKVFKVIWSEARNAYVVVSEIAKNHGSKSCSTKKLLTMLIATGVMTCASMAPAMAANPASDDLNVTIGKGAHVSVWNSVSGQTISGDIAVGPNAHAWNGEYTYRNKYARIGSKEYLLDFGQGGVVGAESIFGIPYKYKVADGSKIAGSIAIGKNTVARTGSVMLGDHSYTGKLGDIEINPANAMTYNDGIYSTTLGAGAYNSGSLAAVTGALSIASGSDTKNTGATIYGSMNSIESATSSSDYSGVASSVLGFANRTQNANAALIWGTGNEVTNSIEKVGIDTNWNNVSVAEAQKKAIEAMQSSDYAGGSVMAIGGGNKADYAKYSQLTGVKNKVTGTEAKAAKYDFVNGYQNTVTNASDVTVIGIKNEVIADGNKVIGDNHKVSGKDNVIFGSADKVTETTVNNAVVLGHNAKVTGEGGVALGAGSVASTAAGVLGYGADGKTDATWQATKGAVSVGGNGATRQITNVAAGTADTDAVNVAQLKTAKTEVKAGANITSVDKTTGANGQDIYTINAKDTTYAAGNGITISGENNAISVKLKEGENNLDVTADGLALKKDLTVNSVNADKFFMDKTTGIGYDGKAYITSNGLNANSQKITNVAAGTADTDAVNVSQLKDVKAEALKHTQVKAGTNVGIVPGETEDGTHVYTVNADGTTVSGDGNVVVTAGEKDANNVTNYGVKLNKDLKGIESVSNGSAKLTLSSNPIFGTTAELTNGQASVSLMGGSTKINGKVEVRQDGTIGGVTAGRSDKDAVNVSQLNNVKAEAGKHTTLSNGKNTTIEAAVKDGQTDYKVNVAGDLTDITSVANGGAKLALNGAAGTAGIVNGKGASVYMQDGYTVINSKVAFDQDGKISGVAAGVNNDDAVNVGQLKKVEEAAGNANKGWNLSTNGVATEATNVKPGDNVDFSGDKNVSVSNDGTAVSVKLNKNLKDIETISNGGATLTLGAMGGMVAELANGQGASVKLFGDTTTINGKVNVYKDGRIAGVADGVNATDAVNVSQLQKAAAASAATVTDGINTTVTTTTAEDGHVDYKVNLNKNLTGVESISNGGASLTMNGFATELANGQGASVKLFGDTTTINGKVNVYKDGRIAGVADGVNATDAVNVSQLQKAAAASATTVSDGVNTTVTATKGEDGHTDYKVNLNKDLVGIESISNGDAKLTLGGFATELTNGQGASVKLFGDATIINGKVNVYNDGRIAGVAAGINDNDAVNVGQLKEAVEAGNTDTHIKAGEYGVGTDNKVNMQLVDKNGKDAGTVTITDVAKASDVGDVNNIASDIKNKEGKTTVVDAVNNLNNKVGDLQYSKVEKGEVADGDSTTTAIGKLDQKLTDVAATAAKHTKVVNGSNITVEETAQDGQKTYKVGLNKDILLGDITGKNVSISGTNGTIETTGYIATKDRVYADKGAKLADVDITGDTISNDKSSVKLDKEGTVTINNKVTIDGNGKVSGVADGEISATSTDAVNGGQLYKTNQAIANNATNISSLSHSISNLDNRVNKVGAGAAALAALHPLDFDPDAKWDFAAGYGNYRGTNAAAVGAYYRPNEDTMFSVGGTFGNGENMVNAGVSFKLGSGSSHVSTSRVAMAKEIKELREHMAAQDKLIAQLTGPVNALTGSHIQADLNTLFPDVPKNHWAYDYVTKLAQEGYIEGYPDGNFKGDAMMTRYEFAAVIYRAMMNGAARDAKLGGDENLNKLLKEFEPELEYIRIDTIAKDKAGNPTIQRVRTVKANTNK